VNQLATFRANRVRWVPRFYYNQSYAHFYTHVRSPIRWVIPEEFHEFCPQLGQIAAQRAGFDAQLLRRLIPRVAREAQFQHRTQARRQARQELLAVDVSLHLRSDFYAGTVHCCRALPSGWLAAAVACACGRPAAQGGVQLSRAGRLGERDAYNAV
jgi:hypothetical protein